jgi:hypothetical protein
MDNRPDYDPVMVGAAWRAVERYWTPQEHAVIRHAARQCVRYESWKMTPKDERQGTSFPEITGEKVIARLVKNDEPRWAKMASSALMLARILDFRAGCGRPETLTEMTAASRAWASWQEEGKEQEEGE